jgi:putative hemolysin
LSSESVIKKRQLYTMASPKAVDQVRRWRSQAHVRLSTPVKTNIPNIWSFAQKLLLRSRTMRNQIGTISPIIQTSTSTTLVHEPVRCERIESDQSWLNIRKGYYRVRLAANQQERLAVYRLRFCVFNLELNEGLESAYENGLDTDEFDPYCDHILVEHSGTGQIVGTYRLQCGSTARSNVGFYSEREFDFSPYRGIENSLVELGRACVHRDHRSPEVLSLLWKGIAQYAIRKEARYLIGCCSLTSQDPAQGAAVYARLHDYLTKPDLRTTPQLTFVMPLMDSGNSTGDIPKLLRTYLAVGAKICGPPAIDRDFKTIDFLTLMDIEELNPRLKSRLIN